MSLPPVAADDREAVRAPGQGSGQRFEQEAGHEAGAVHRSPPTALLRALVRGYQLLLSPWLGNQCRFVPRCSDYALDALDEHGAARGSYLTLKRIGRCHPWCAGGYDPVPRRRASSAMPHPSRPA